MAIYKEDDLSLLCVRELKVQISFITLSEKRDIISVQKWQALFYRRDGGHMEFIRINGKDEEAIRDLSAMATEIVREHYDPILGKEQNDYMLEKFQSPDALKKQTASGYVYYTARVSGKNVGFFAFYPRGDAMYLSKLYIYKSERGKGYSKQMIAFVSDAALKSGLPRIELNVNRTTPSTAIYEALGFVRLRSEKTDIGSGYFMDDYVYGLDLEKKKEKAAR